MRSILHYGFAACIIVGIAIGKWWFIAVSIVFLLWGFVQIYGKKDRVVIVLNVLHLVAQVMQVQTINKASINYKYFT